MRKWTAQQDMQVMAAAKNNPDHLRKAFLELSKTIGRSSDSIVTRYYNTLLKKCDVCKDSGAITVGEGEYATCPCVNESSEKCLMSERKAEK